MRIFKDLTATILAALSVMMSACVGGNGQNEEKGECEGLNLDSIHEVTLLEENISYSACLDCNILDDRTMEVWGPQFVCKDAHRPVVMFVPSMQTVTVEEFVRPLVENGYIVAVPKCANIKNERKNDKTLDGLRCGVNDLSDAVRKVKLNYEKYGADTSNIFLAGYGSGAEIAMTYCYITGLYDKVDMDGIRGVIALAPKTSLNFDHLDRNDDCSLLTLILVAENESDEVKEAVSALQRQLGDLAWVRTMPAIEEQSLNLLSDSLHVHSAKFVNYILRQ